MCDTMVIRNDKESFFIFGKNSDRHPHEIQLIQYVEPFEGLREKTHIDYQKEYEQIRYPLLQKYSKGFKNSYSALISRPSWMYGCEMGVNEKGLAIGNEAVFSLAGTNKEGILGMDILRLALHNCSDAKSALIFISEFIENYGQGGNGSYKGTLRYNNSFLITDSKESYLIESHKNRWVAKKIDLMQTISNSYSITTDYDMGDQDSLKKRVDFKRSVESKLHLLFTQGDYRQNLSSSLLQEGGGSWETVSSALRYNKANNLNFDRSMRSICIDSDFLVKSKTTNSMIVEYLNGKSVIWLTGSPFPIFSPFYPFEIEKDDFSDSGFNDINFSYEFAKKQIANHRQIMGAPKEAQKEIIGEIKKLETSFRDKVLEKTKVDVIKEQEAFTETVKTLIGKG
ncbi:MAG: carcinine hydrolase/isopenicillin-N N-acyltransferase family protein [Sphaerochaetaceae bacterium]